MLRPALGFIDVSSLAISDIVLLAALLTVLVLGASYGLAAIWRKYYRRGKRG